MISVVSSPEGTPNVTPVSSFYDFIEEVEQTESQYLEFIAKACQDGNLNVIIEMINNNSDNFPIKIVIENICKGICENSDMSVLEYLIINYVIDLECLNYGLGFACEYGNKSLVRYFLDAGANDYMRGFYYSNIYGFDEIAKEMKERGKF